MCPGAGFGDVRAARGAGAAMAAPGRGARTAASSRRRQRLIGLVDLPALEEMDAHRLPDLDRLAPAAARQDEPASAAVGDRLAELAQGALVELQQRVVPHHLDEIDVDAAQIEQRQRLVDDAVEAALIASPLQRLGAAQEGG